MNDIKCDELIERQNNGDKLNILDVREEWEFNETNMNGKLIPLHELPNRLDEISDWKNEEIIVHCKSGMRSNAAKQMLLHSGFSNVRNLIGGILTYNGLK